MQDVDETWTTLHSPPQQQSRHVAQLFIRGDNISMIRRLDND